MARVEGEAGRYAVEQVGKYWTWGVLACFAATMVCGVLLGFALAMKNPWVGWGTIAAQLGVFWAVMALLRKFDKDMSSWRRGYDGETMVGRKLAAELPDSFRVIHDLQTPCGNLDHVVIGPTGVFVIETKNWRGWVTADGKGELLLNGKPSGNHVRSLYGRMMEIKKRWVPLTLTTRDAKEGPRHYIRAVMVFSSAYEDTSWGTTQSINCISIASVPDYFTKMQKEQHRLSNAEVDTFARAFLALARMDKGFTSPDAEPTASTK